MSKTANLAVALLPLMAACDAAPPATAPPALGEPAPFDAPTPPTHPTAGSPGSAGAVGARGDDPPVGAPDIRVIDAVPRAQDLGQAVVAGFPAAISRLGSPARVHVHVEGVDSPLPGQAVVVFVGVEFGAATPTPLRRVAVPTQWDGNRWIAGTPWDLSPAPAATARESLGFATLPADDPGLLALAVDALEVAGWENVVIESLRLPIEGWAHPVTFEAIRRGSDGQRDRQVVWLRRHLDHFVVAGTHVPPTTPERPHEQDPA